MIRPRTLHAFALAAVTACGPPPSLPYEDTGPPIDAPDVGAPDTGVHATVTPYAHPDFTLVLPYLGLEQTADVTVTATAQNVDVHLLIDSTASFNGEIVTLQQTLNTQILPTLRSRIPSLTVGVSSFEDMPFLPFGLSTDRPFVLYTSQTNDPLAVNNAVNRLNMPLGNGADRPEAWGEALFQVATGLGLVAASGYVLIQPFVPSTLGNAGTIGGVGFRDHSARAVVLVTDAPTHAAGDYAALIPSAHTMAQSLAALQALEARVIGIVALADARPGIEEVAMATGAVEAPTQGRCLTGLAGMIRLPVNGVCPLVFDLATDGSGLNLTIVDALRRLLAAAVYAEVHGAATDDADGFLTAVEAVSATPPSGGASPGIEDRRPVGAPDGIADTFTTVGAQTQLVFRMHFRNLHTASTELPQVRWIHVQMLGDGQVLDEVLVRVIVPEGPKFDGGDGVDAMTDASGTARTGAGVFDTLAP